MRNISKNILTGIIFLASFFFLSNIFTSTTLAAANSRWCVEGESIRTAIGCISVNADLSENSFFSSLSTVIVGVAGGLALLMMLYGIYIIISSAGNPDKIAEGKTIITSSIAGLLFILLSSYLYSLIGINILGLPGLE